MVERESMEFDVVIVGGGPAGLSAAIRLKQLNDSLTVCIVEKGAEIGAHILSGAVLEPRALNELLPNWQELNAPLNTPVTKDEFYFLKEKSHKKLPTPPQMKNHGNYIISLGNFCRWLAQQAENLGVEIYPGFAASEILYRDDDTVYGVATGNMGIDKENQHTSNYQPGMELHAKQTLFAEGCRGQLSKQLMAKFNLTKNADPQTYGIGIKELWQVESSLHQPGKVTHTIGWPLTSDTYGGSFIYHLQEDNLVAYGFVVGLDYRNPYLSPFQEMQRFKTHPFIQPLFENGKRIAYGARALNEGGFQSIPKLSFPGGLIIGDSAGFLNVAKIKGTHTAMKSGMIAAECVYEQLEKTEIAMFNEKMQQSWVVAELKKVRNIRPAFRYGLWPAIIYAAIDTYVFRGHAPWTFHHHHPDNDSLVLASAAEKINYPKPDNKITFDRLSSVYLSGAQHEENQPCHLTLGNNQIPIDVNYNLYDSPETRYCPAGVYEIVTIDNEVKLQINAPNCVHCKTCDIKDPKQNITWVAPEGGGGPNYPNM